MKGIYFFLAIVIAAGVGVANGVEVKGLNFVAPSIVGKGNVYGPEAGEIIYDQSDSTFYGRDHNGSWVSLSSAGGSVPSGTILPYGGTTAPGGFVFCDGSTLDRTDYSDLFAAIGTSFGEGDGSTTFNLPDLRGRFLRGVDGSAGNDPDSMGRTAMNSGGNTGNTVGSVQGDGFQGHQHTFSIKTANDGSGGGAISSGAFAANQPWSYFGPSSQSIEGDGTNGMPRVSSETRPKNANVNFIIKL